MENKKRGLLIAVLVVSAVLFSFLIVYELNILNSQKNSQSTKLVMLNEEQISSEDLPESTISSENPVSYSTSHKKRGERTNPEISGLSVSNSPTENSIPEVANNLAPVADSSIPESSDQSQGTVQPRDLIGNANCQTGSRETNEGPAGSYCKYEDYEECHDYLTKSTAIAYGCSLIPLGCRELERGTDYCTNSDKLNEAYLECSFFTVGPDSLNWEQKNCNDYDQLSAWTYYCTTNEVRKKQFFSNFGCGDGACKVVWSGWINDQLVSKKGDIGYCNSRKNNGCSLCVSGGYDCDWSSDCGGALQCKGSASITYCPLAECGCCSSWERWDSTQKTCCECDTVSSCCDGCNFKSSSTVCNSHTGGVSYSCNKGGADGCLGEDVYKTDNKQYCSGSSSSCNGNVVANPPVVYDDCTSNEFCDADKGGSNPFSCSSAQCTSGVCCDTTCGVYKFESDATKCFEGMDYGCFWGNDLGDDVSQRTLGQYCSGSSSSCSGRLTNGGWTVFDECNNQEWCEGTQGANPFWCSGVTCSADLDCGTGYWYGAKCDLGDVYGNFVSYDCKSPGTKQAQCTNQVDYIKKQECGANEYIGNNYCWNNDVYKDYITKGCSSSKCTNSTLGVLQQDCGTWGCSNGQCNGDPCTNNCSVGEKRCTEEYVQTCGNYDSDSCLEWPSSTGDNGNEYCEYGCTNSECNEVTLDLTITDLVIQKISGKTVTLAFTVENIGNAVADNIYWMADSDSADNDPSRTTLTSLDPGEHTRAYMMIVYANSGAYNPKVIVDQDNLIVESNEDNNEQSISVSV